jgi:hypothetical protein
MRKSALFILLLTACTSSAETTSSTSQAVTGTCSSPIPVSSNGDQAAGTTVGGSSNTSCDNSLSHNANDWTTDIGCSDVVYKITGAGTTVTATLRASGADWNAVLYVRSATQGCTTDAYAAITDGSERTAGANESVSWVASAGVDYYLSVAGYGGGGNACASGGYILNISGLPSGNGTCASPTAITTSGDQATQTLVGRSSSTDVDNSLSHNPNDWTTDIGCPDYVYKLTGTGSPVTVTTRPSGTDWNGVLYVRSASQGCTSDPHAAITDGSERVAGANESVTFTAASGVDYYLSVGSYGVASQGTCSGGGSFILNVGGTPPPTGPQPYAQWANGTPEISQAVRAGWKWYNTGYPGTASSSSNSTLLAGGVTPIAYINSTGVARDDASLVSQINQYFPGTDYHAIVLCSEAGWPVDDIDITDSRWQNWLIARAEYAYSLGNRGVFWDQARVENVCNGYGGNTTKQQAAIQALVNVTATLKARHPDMIFVVNQGFGVANANPSQIAGLTEENLLNYLYEHPGDSWAQGEINACNALQARGVEIIDLEYIDLMGCGNTTCSEATQLINQAHGYNWAPYVTNQAMNIEGRGYGIMPPW